MRAITMSFPIDVGQYKPVAIDPFKGTITPEQRQQLLTNIQVVRDTIIFFTAAAGVKGLGGHTGGAYSIVPEVLIADSFMKATDKVYPVYFDEAGHRVAIQYAMAAFNGEMPFEKLLQYRAANEGLYGHPELDPALGIKFASGRLGHLWPFVNGVALGNRDKAVFLFGSDGSQQEGDDAEAARLAVAQQINVKLCIDDNNVTISGHPSDYLPGFDVAKTLMGHGLRVDVGQGEDFDSLFARMAQAVQTPGPVALVNRRRMAPGVPGIEGSHAGHDVIAKQPAIDYLTQRGLTDAVDYINNIEKPKSGAVYKGSSRETASNRTEFGTIVNGILDAMPESERKARVLVVDSDLEGSTGLKGIRVAHPEVFINGGVQERGNFSAAAGFGFEKGRQGIFSTFSAFLEMIISEATMARLNGANVICHFSHAGVDDMADNTCHYGVNIFLADSGLPEGDATRLYFAADALQLKSLVHAIWDDPGMRFVFSTRSKVPFILNEDGSQRYGGDYQFVPGRDEIIREGSAGYVISYGDILYRALDAVERAREAGLDVGLINKPTLNVVDEAMMEKIGGAPFVLVAEAQNRLTGLGSRFGSWLLERGHAPKYAWLAVTKPGHGGLSEHVFRQGIDSDSILSRIRTMA
ncbi:MAG TPA: transketolase [Candidatus Hydrogenedentes bacterium]|nr:transketolase [Candidatus Hydrogenedentota bacterium]